MDNPAVRPAFLSRMVEIILVATAWALPLLVLPGLLSDAAELPKLAALALSTGLLAGIALSRWLVARERAFPGSPLAVPVAALLVMAGVSLAGSRAPGAGYYAFLYLSAMAVAWAMASSLTSRRQVVQAILVSAGIVALYALGQFVGFEPLSWSSHFKPRVFSSLGNPVFLGGFLASVFPLAFARWLAAESEEEKDLLTLLLAVMLSALYLTWTRGSWIAVFVATSVQLAALSSFPGGRAILQRNRAWLVTLGVLALIAGIILASPRVLGKNPVPFGDRLKDALDAKSFSVRFRMGTAEVAWKMAFAHPVTGGGLGSYGAWYPLERLKTRAAKGGWLNSQEYYTHNDHLQFLGELGVAGFGIWLWLLITALRWAWHLNRRENAEAPGEEQQPQGYPLGALGVITAVAVDATFNFPLHIGPTAWVFFTVLGMMAVSSTAVRVPDAAVSRNRIAASSAIIALCTTVVGLQIVRHIQADLAMHEAESYYMGNNFEMAEVYFGQGAALTPMNRLFHFRRSVTLLRVGGWEWRGESQDRALYHAKRAIALGLQEENAWKQLGDVYGKKGMIPRAISALETSHALNAQREDITNNLAYYLAIRGERLDEAVRLAREAVARAPKDPTYNDTLGYTLIRAGRYADAVAPLRLALKSLPADGASQAIRSARAEVLMHLDCALKRKPLK